ncbi:MAG: DUF1566 domain-containing protein [Deltaproteobacteria bacterium]|nr:DUF1566 domain-containing protein [Deltaproteobacteria bacterium]
MPRETRGLYLSIAFLLSLSCGSDGTGKVCSPDEERECECPGGRAGVQACLSDGSAFDDCRCECQTDCDDGIACTDDSCDTSRGECRSEPDDGLCDDGDDGTADRCSVPYGCAHDRGSWTLYDSGWLEDRDTGLGWSPFVTDMTLEDAVEYCSELSLGGIEDWRLPDVDQVRTLIAGCPGTEAGSSCPLDDPDCLGSACGAGADCESCQGGAGPNDGLYSKPGFFPDVSVIRSISGCSDCAGEQSWVVGFTNANFYTHDDAAVLHFCCAVSL